MTTHPRLISVIHYENNDQVMRNAERTVNAGFDGTFLINMTGDDAVLPSTAQTVKRNWPQLLVGTNLLSTCPYKAFQFNLLFGLDMTWTDQQLTHSSLETVTSDTENLARALAVHPEHCYFTGVAFKHQPHEPDPRIAARRAREFGMIPTTSGSKTGSPADHRVVAQLKRNLKPGSPLAIASGITLDNVYLFSPHVSHILVATGVSSSFFEFDPNKLKSVYNSVHA